MIFHTLKGIDSSRDVISTFYGYDHNVSISDGAFYDMKNLTSTYYPVLSPRGKRGIYKETTSPNGLIHKDGLFYVDGGYLYKGGTKVDGLTLTDSRKQLVSMGAYIIIMPDKKYINTQNLEDYGSIEKTFTSSGKVTYQMCNLYGEAYGTPTVSATEPSNPSDKALWIDTSSTPNSLKQYSKASAMWVSIATAYVKISAKNIAHQFSSMDAVKISGIDSSITRLGDLEGQTSIIWDLYKDTTNDGADDYVIVVGILEKVYSQTSALTLSMDMPDMDFLIESNNRLWGCRYGLDSDGNMLNEIYACKLGDFHNWNFFAGTSADSYVASCGTDGAFTGAINHLGYPLFFKENCLHKVYGNYPSNYQIQSTDCKGVQKGAGNSLAIVNGTLFYKSASGICYYDGSLPTETSSALGTVYYTGVDSDDTDKLRNGAVAGSFHNKYYISMKSEADNEWHLFVFDVSNGMWHREDNTRVDAFCASDNEMYYIDHDTKKIMTVNGSGTAESKEVDWMAETGMIGLTIRNSSRTTTSLVGKKYISQLLVRLSLGIGSRVMFYIQYDSNGEWEHIATMVGTHTRSFCVPIKPKRCDHFRLRIVGTGEAKIYSVAKSIEQGSDY